MDELVSSHIVTFNLLSLVLLLFAFAMPGVKVLFCSYASVKYLRSICLRW
jgi:hypothetical protein